MDIKKLFRSLDCGRDGVMDYEEWSKSVGFHALSERDLFQVANRKTFPAVSSIAWILSFFIVVILVPSVQ
jgi:hypothetical protein